MLSEIDRLTKAALRVLKHDGMGVLVSKTLDYTQVRVRAWLQRRRMRTACKDVLFICGCALEHPRRYRVTHQMEQLHFNGFSCDEVWYEQVALDLVKYYRAFIFFIELTFGINIEHIPYRII